MKSLTPRLFTLILAGLLLGSCSLSKSPVTGKKRAYAYSWEKELQIGKEADPQIVAQFGVYDNAELTAYVTRVGEEILAKSHLRRPETPQEYHIPFTFRVLDSPIVNAFALPGGYVYVTRGLLVHLDNEAQLAVVLGHEIGHVAARHSSQRALSQTLGQIGVIAGAIASEVAFGGGQQFLQLGGTAFQLLFLRYSRDNERESDKLGVEYSAMDNYMASEGSAFFGTLKRITEKAGQTIPSFLLTHPEPGEREQKIKQMAAGWADQYTMNKRNQEALYNVIDGIVLGDDPRQGYVDNNVFYHPELKFQFPTPAEWTVINQPSQVAMVQKDQKAILLLGLEQGVQSPSEAASKLGQEEGITVKENRSTRVNGLPAHYIKAQAQGQNNQTLDILAYYIQYGGNIYRILGYSATADFSSYRRTFERTMTGFRELRDRAKINVQPSRLQIVRVPKTGTFKSFVAGNLPKQFSAEDFAILNQVELNTQVSRGAALKLIQ